MIKFFNYLILFIVLFASSCYKNKISDLSGFWVVSGGTFSNDKNIDMSDKTVFGVCLYPCYYCEKISDTKYKFKSASDVNGTWQIQGNLSVDAVFDKKSQTFTIDNSLCIAFNQPLKFKIVKVGENFSMTTSFTIFTTFGYPTISPPYGPDSVYVTQTLTKVK